MKAEFKDTWKARPKYVKPSDICNKLTQLYQIDLVSMQCLKGVFLVDKYQNMTF